MFRKSTWFDTKKLKEVYGIKVKHEGQWMDAGDGNGVLFFETQEERDIELDKLKAKGIPATA